ncbi:epidermal growth factor receptor kinase substrate 8-like [Myzus persicae]|uniref:epidermal growth factor receptor kinase substrate 8-like n=1 Tax=Myzus persicae TaxID=13164 RepID=UPI000B933099|nr:epidermal growth factor receptor kinase substrate 8-like [Myzus persicae]
MPGLKDMSMQQPGNNSKRDLNEKPIMPYHRNSVNSNGYSTDGGQQSIAGEERNGDENNSAPTYVIEHLATFTVSKSTGIVYPADGMRRLLHLEKSNGIWSQKMQLRLDQSWVLIMDFETGVVMERFPISLVKEPTAFTSNDPMEIYNNILVFVVGQVDSRSEMHIFQSQSVPAQELVDDLKLLRSGKGINRKSRHVPPPPPTPPPNPPSNGVSVREQVSVFNAVAHHSDNITRVDDETSSTSSEKYERDVIVLNHCFDDIEKFIARLQHAAAASRELERRRRNRKSKKKDIGDGMLTMRAKPPPEIEFIDIFQKFKLSFNLLAKLKAHIHDPNAPELVHFLFTPLALIVDASHDTQYKPNIPSRVVSPLLTRDAINLLMNCVTSKETELWHSLGDAWLIPREQWKGYAAPYHPIFMDGWSPEYPIPVSDDHLTNVPTAGVIESKKSRDEIKNSNPEGELRDTLYHHRDREHTGVGDDSSDYFEYEHEQSAMMGIRPQYTFNTGGNYSGHHQEQFGPDDRDDSHSLEGESEPDFNTLSLHSPPRMDKERADNMAARSDISADSIERNNASGPGSERFERAQARWLEDMRARGVKIVQVTYPRTANNDKELSVVRGELLEILDDSRKWWKARNNRSQVAHVPHTIVTPFNPMLDSNDIFTNPVYAKGYDKRSASQSQNYTQESIKSDFVDQSMSSDPSRNTSVPPPGPAPADWVRKERIGKKGEFRYF